MFSSVNCLALIDVFVFLEMTMGRRRRGEEFALTGGSDAEDETVKGSISEIHRENSFSWKIFYSRQIHDAEPENKCGDWLSISL